MRYLKISFICLIVFCAMSLVSCGFLAEEVLNDLLFGDELQDSNLALGGEDDSALDFYDHECDFGEWTVVEEAACDFIGLEERICKICEDIEERDIPSLPHTVVIDEAVEETDSKPGKTEGSHCSVCGTIIKRQEYIYFDDYSNPAKYSGDYAYEYLLSNYKNGDDMQAFYRFLDEEIVRFHSSSEDAKTKIVSETTLYYVAELDFSVFGLSSEEAITVWNAYRFDHPLYYWMSNLISYQSKKLTVTVYEDYADGETRLEYNSAIYETVELYMDGIGGRGDEYKIVRAFHDGIILNADYAYEEDGVTPEDAAYAHNVLGVLLEGEGVCESYTKAFQLLLNYCGINNVYVTGYAGEAHAWNLVEMSDGEWYWFDLTWDDTPNLEDGVRYTYFCVIDDAFLTDHVLYNPVDYGIEFVYAIPERSTEYYEYE